MVGDCAKSHLGVVVFHGGVVVADRCVGGQEGRVVEARTGPNIPGDLNRQRECLHEAATYGGAISAIATINSCFNAIVCTGEIAKSARLA